jgi:hypothetical protein
MSVSEIYTDAWKTNPPSTYSLTTGVGDRSGATTGSATQDPARARLVSALGGTRGVVDGGLPPLLFALVNAVVGANGTRPVALGAAIGAAAATGSAIVVLRLVRHEPLRQALGGLGGLTIAIAFAVQSGEARGFFLPGIYVDAAYAIAFLASALIGRPLVGAVYGLLSGRRGSWRENARLRRTLTRATIGWSLTFAVRAGVQALLYVNDEPALLAVSKLLLGWPLTILAVGLTFAAIGRVTRHTS